MFKVSAPAEGPAPESDEEKIIVTRQEEERDPEAEAEFDRELAKLTSESLDSRKFERRPIFDVPLPLRRNERAPVEAAEQGPSAESEVQRDTMAFSLLTKRGNRQQVWSSVLSICRRPGALTGMQTRTVDLPANSSFAVALQTQRQAERDEQKRIKDLVLNYDLRSEDQDGKKGF